MRKIFFLFWICSYLITIRAEIKSISESLNQLTERIDKLNRTYMSIDEKIEIIIVKRNEERLELKKSEINTLKDDIIKKKNKIKESLKNELNLYFGFLLPKNSTFRNYGIHFEHGSQFELEYARRFGSFSLGTSVSGKFFGNDKIVGDFGMILEPVYNSFWGSTFVRVCFMFKLVSRSCFHRFPT